MIEQGGAAEAAINSVNDTIDSITNSKVILVADWLPRGEIAVEQLYIDCFFKDLTSVPVLRDALRNETNSRYFNFEGI